MVSDALAGERMIGMVLLQPGYEADYERAPAVYDVGCAGLITHVERLRGRALQHRAARPRAVPHRRRGEPVLDGAVPARADRPARRVDAAAPPAGLKRERQKLEALLAPLFSGTLAERGLPPQMPDDELINALAQYLELEPIEKQALLERDGPLARCRSLVELLEMKALT